MECAKKMAVLLLVLLAGTTFAADLPSGQDAGKHIYRDGKLPSGALLRGVLRNGTELSGADAACAKCHRRSGMGSGEGQKVIRPISGRLLFEPPDVTVTERHQRSVQAQAGRERPPYSVKTLARVLREGVDPSGRSLDELMPRFDMNDEEIVQLASYLKGLSRETAPGVSESEIHFATVVTPGVDPARTEAMLDVLEAFFSSKNAGTRKEGNRKSIDRERMYSSYRTWVLHIWKLEGLPETWSAQLEDYYRKQPVFAMLSGIGAGNWRPVHEFCEQAGLPCLFPNVDYPVVSETDYASIYFSRGIMLEAEVLAKHLADAGLKGQSGPIVQVFRDDAIGRVPPRALRSALRRSGINDVSDHPLAGEQPVSAAFCLKLASETKPGGLVLWLNDNDVNALHKQCDALFSGIENIYLSGSLIAQPQKILQVDGWLDRVRLVYPFELSERRAQRLSRMQHWLEARNIPLREERVQAGAYFAAAIAGDALSLMGENFSRDYFIERVEKMTENSLSSAVYPRLSLGAGQRFASRGAYVARFTGDGESKLVPVSGWIVP